jgi:hypothetical protein
MSDTQDVEVFRIPDNWYRQYDRTPEEVLRRLGFVRMPGGGWACDDEVARRLVNTVCAYSFEWRSGGRP